MHRIPSVPLQNNPPGFPRGTPLHSAPSLRKHPRTCREPSYPNQHLGSPNRPGRWRCQSAPTAYRQRRQCPNRPLLHHHLLSIPLLRRLRCTEQQEVHLIKRKSQHPKICDGAHIFHIFNHMMRMIRNRLAVQNHARLVSSLAFCKPSRMIS